MNIILNIEKLEILSDYTTRYSKKESSDTNTEALKYKPPLNNMNSSLEKNHLIRFRDIP